MRGFFRRLKMVLGSKAHRALDKAEDPNETLDYSYRRQLELLQKVYRGVADVATSIKRLELQINQQEMHADRLHEQARKAMSLGREDLAREALTRRSAITAQTKEMQSQYDDLRAEEEKLRQAADNLRTKVEMFRSRKETLKARYNAARAQSMIGESFAGISEEFGDVGRAIQSVEDKTLEMRARAGAIDELIFSGALSVLGERGDDLDRALADADAPSDIEMEMQRLRTELTAPRPVRQIEAPKQNNFFKSVFSARKARARR